MKKKKERDGKGRFAKGHKGGPGRPKGEPRDVTCKDGKKRSVEDLISDLLAAYETLGGKEFLKKWALHSHSNLRKFVDILFKFAVHPEMVDGKYPSLSMKKLKGSLGSFKVISAVPRIDDRAAVKRIKELEDQLKERDEELYRFRASVDVQDSEEIKHEPIPPLALPEHDDAEIKPMSNKELDELADLNEEELEKRLNSMTEAEEKRVYNQLVLWTLSLKRGDDEKKKKSEVEGSVEAEKRKAG